MVQPNHNWDRGRVAVEIRYIPPGTTVQTTVHLILPNRATTDIKFNYEPIHGLNEWNVAIKELPPEFTFVLALPVVSPHVRLLRQLHVSGLPFTLVLTDETTGKFTGNMIPLLDGDGNTTLDDNGNVVSPAKPIDAWNHGIDSVRYSLSYVLNRQIRY